MIRENLTQVRQNIELAKKNRKHYFDHDVKLVAVTKNHDVQAMREAIDYGIQFVGENRIQEAMQKAEVLERKVEWHLIGHLQTNKVKYIVPYVSLIHGVDSFKLLSEIDRQAAKISRQIVCLLQFHIAQEQTKYGFSLAECEQMLQSQSYKQLQDHRL